MARGEIEEAFQTASRGAPSRALAEIDEIIAETTREIDDRRSAQNFWWTIVPVPPLKVDFVGMTEEDRKFCRGLLTEPSSSGNRRTGWTMVFDGATPRQKTTGMVQTFGDPPRQHQVKLEPSGKMTFTAPRVRLDQDWRLESPEIFPLALIELPVSGFRMAAKFIERFGTPAPPRLIVAAVIGGMKDARLRPGSPSEPLLPWKTPGHFDDDDLIVQPFEVEGEHFREKPDAAAYGLILRIYEQFGLDAADIPPEFDPADRILRFGRQ
jgi:hypothetical protein